MATLPSATLSVQDNAGGFAGGTGYAVVMSCVGQNADMVPRVFASSAAVAAQHGYGQGVDYAAFHINDTRLPVIFCGLPASTAGQIISLDNTAVLGTSQISVSADTNGVLDEVNAIVTCSVGGTVGTNGIQLLVSMDGGRSVKTVRLGTASTYALPLLGIVLNFGPGTLLAGDKATFTTVAPMWNQTSLQTARQNLAAQQKAARSWIVCGDLPNSTFATYVTGEVNSYETANQRFTYARTSVKDQLLAKTGRLTKRATGVYNLTFTDVGISGDTITRSAGSFITDGFAVGDTFTVTGSVSNNVTAQIVGLSATVITLGSTALVAEGPVSATITASSTRTFAAGAKTLTRTLGSFINDGFAVGDTVAITGTASNNGTFTLSAVTDTVATVNETFVNETTRGDAMTFTKVQALSAYVSASDAAFSTIDAQKRIDMSIGRARRASLLTSWLLRRPAAWAASLREYQHDLQIPCWRKSDGPLSQWDITDGNGNVVEYDERTIGGALAARFTCLRTWANGPNGAFVALSLTRQTESSLLSRTHNLAVTNLACSVAQAETENAIGQVLQLNTDGTATLASLQQIEMRVNSQLQINMLASGSEGPRASSATWQASRTDVLNVTGAKLHGVLSLNLNGTIENVDTVVAVNTGS